MSRLSVLVRFLSVMLLILLARVLIDGLTVGIGGSAALVAALLVFATALLRHGRRLEIALASSTPTPRRTR
jgi:hypothetical protein